MVSLTGGAGEPGRVRSALRRVARTCRLMALCGLAALLPVAPALAEDGHGLWLRYVPVQAAQAAGYRARATELVVAATTPTGHKATRDELQRGLQGLLGATPAPPHGASRDGAVLVGTPAGSPQLAALKLDLEALGGEGYLIRSVRIDGRPATAVAANTDVGALYGAFHFLRLVQTGQSLDALDIREVPKLKVRVLNHWDNLDRHVERGYAGESIWDWHRLPGWKDPRYTDYARANASIGINGTVLNNVNSNARSLTPAYLEKAAALAGVFRPYGIKVYLSARFSAPIEIGGLKTADPLDPAVRRWWKAKADEVYRTIPDFGGFLVKANSEGQPGPQDYGRTHVDGANMLAEAVAPHGGIVMWRAFVYSHEQPDDRAKAGVQRVRALRRQVRVQRAGPGQERRDRLPAARAVPSAVRRDAEDAADDGVPDHQGVPGLRHPPYLPGDDV